MEEQLILNIENDKHKNNSENSNDLNEVKLDKLEVERYCRQMILPEILSKGQKKLKQAKVLVVGAGGLGSPCLMYLAGSGVGTIGIVDGDYVDTSNLHRQVIHQDKNKGTNKSVSAAMFIKSYNPLVSVVTYEEHFTRVNSIKIASNYDLLIDCSDNPATRYLVNDTAVVLKIPLVSGSAIRWEGQLTVLGFNSIISRDNKECCEVKKLPCYRCLFPIPSPTLTVGACSEEGVLGPVPGVIGVLQATEAIKIILGFGDKTLTERMLMYDAMEMKFKIFKIKGWRKECLVCGENANINEDFVKNFDYEEFASPKLCRKPKKVDIPNEYNITWTELFDKVFNTSNILQEKLKNDEIKDIKLTNGNNDDNKVLLLDVRTKEQFDLYNFKSEKDLKISQVNEFSSNKIDEFVKYHEYLNVPLNNFLKEFEDLEKNGILNKNKNIFVTCRSGMKSTYAVDHLITNGYTKIYNLVEGMHGYIKEIDNQSVPFY